MRIMKNKIVSFISILCLLVLFSGCSDGIDDKTKNQTVIPETFHVKAYLKNASDSSKIMFSSRSAYSSFSDEINWTVEAFQENETITPVLAVVEEDGSFSLSLEDTGTWYLRAIGMKDENVVMRNRTPVEINLTETEPIIITVYPVYGNEKGSVNLNVIDGTEKSILSSVKWIWDDDISEEASFDFNEQLATIEFSDIEAGEHIVTLEFYLDQHKLYSCSENITIFSGFTTDTWYGTSPYMVKAEDNYSFIITDSIISSYVENPIVDYPIIMWSKKDDGEVSEPNSLIAYGNRDYSGFEVFSEVNVADAIGNNIGKTLANEYIFNFFIDAKTQKVYSLEKNNDEIKIVKYPTYGGYKYGKQVCNSSEYPALSDIRTCYAYDDVIWIDAINSSNSSHAIYCVRNNSVKAYSIYEADGETLISYNNWVQYNSYSGGKKLYDLQLCSDGEYVYILYISDEENSGNMRFSVKQFSVLTEDCKLVQVAEYETTADDLGIKDTEAEITFNDNTTNKNLSLGESFSLNDLIVEKDQNGNSSLYALICDYDYTAFTDEEHNAYMYYGQSRGGLLKFECSEVDGNKTVVLTNIENGISVFGWLPATVTGCNYNAPEYYDSLDESEKDNAVQYLYGPQRFIARKPDELIIADEGSYGYGDGNSNTNKNRVYTLNLRDLSVTSTEVAVSFNTCLSSDFKMY